MTTLSKAALDSLTEGIGNAVLFVYLDPSFLDWKLGDSQSVQHDPPSRPNVVSPEYPKPEEHIKFELSDLMVLPLEDERDYELFQLRRAENHFAGVLNGM